MRNWFKKECLCQNSTNPLYQNKNILSGDRQMLQLKGHTGN